MSNLVELRQIAKNLNVKGHSVLKKADLISAIEKAKAPAATAEVPVAVVDIEQQSPVKVTKEKKIKPALLDGEKAPRKANEWNSFLNDYRKEKGLSLRQAMSEAKTAYAELKSKPKEM